jgi:hypothetical protein
MPFISWSRGRGVVGGAGPVPTATAGGDAGVGWAKGLAVARLAAMDRPLAAAGPAGRQGSAASRLVSSRSEAAGMHGAERRIGPLDGPAAAATASLGGGGAAAAVFAAGEGEAGVDGTEVGDAAAGNGRAAAAAAGFGRGRALGGVGWRLHGLLAPAASLPPACGGCG